ncbi:protein kinase domain-containing protein [Rhodococcus erythropolis]|uniref:Putative serine/threonine protein kinase n=1 Tax=Rhodococcus erythropolis (strain PR4 / NBRC 100887) TaxID=234621 RepID=C0ZQ44_RHOE4|nr:protein kinase [Rhodococcus erythropolis]BAH31522.1 putative serine/threonine protein kinase [Rhodococcus erythropolis PR4]
MTDVDPFATQRDVADSVEAELAAIGFEDAHEIGRGGFGVVYRCIQPSLDRTVAVKVLTADLDDENRARFLREQRAAGRLTGHPNIVNVLQVGVTDTGRPFTVMPYYTQDSLDTRIRNHGALPLNEALRLGEKIAGALESAHRLDILHRDVKPGNILLTDYGEPALSDFGIAHIVGGFATGTGVVTGSPAFIAPEIVVGEPPSSAADVYGLGATLFATITGHAAFERRSGEQLVAQFLRITSEPAPDPREYGVADDVGAIIEGAMSADPGSRPSAEVLGRQLRESQRRHGLPVDDRLFHSAPVTGGSDSPAELPELRSGSGASRENPIVGAGVFSDRTGGLPLELTSFVDRRTELVEVKNLLSTARLVTLTGIGGVGKTRLAMRVAAKSQHSFSDGVWLVELVEVHDATLLADVVAGALGLRDRSARPALEVLVDFLAPRELLLILDNCEHVLEAVAALAGTLLRSCADLTILATSREEVGIAGESVLSVPPLPIPDLDHLSRGVARNDAVRLFVERGAGAVPGFALAESNQVAIARICRQLEGLPLPIELAAARLRAMSPEQILQRLTDRYALLTRGSRSAPSRQRTLRMCVDWSFDLCTPVERALWARLSVFTGGFELDAAEQVCGEDLSQGELLDTVTFLVEKSILTREKSGATVRFRMLETLRDYGREKAEETGVYYELCSHHRDWCERLVLAAEEEWIGPRQLEWIATLVRENANLRQALEFCASGSPETGIRIASALYPFWLSQSSFNEGRYWLNRFPGFRTGPLTVEHAKAFYVGCLLAAVQGDLQASSVLAEEGRVLADQVTDPMTRAHIDHADGYVALLSGNLSDSRSHFENAVQAYREQKALLFEVLALVGLGMTRELLNDTARAVECYERVLVITEARGEAVLRAYSLWALAVAVWRQDDRARAVRLLEQALQLGRRGKDRLHVSMCLQVLAWIALDRRDIRRAAVLLGASEKVSKSVGSSPVVVPGLAVHRDACEAEVRRLLGEQGFAAAQRKGRALGFHGAVAYALGEQSLPVGISVAGPSVTPTKREIEVAGLVAAGLTNKEIAARLVISPRTAQGHVEHLLVKLGFTSRSQIAVWVVESKSGPSEQ